MALQPRHPFWKPASITILGLLLLLWIVPGSVLAANDSPDEVEITYVTGRVNWRNAATDQWQSLSKGMRLSTGAEIQTTAGSRVEMRLVDGSILRLAARSHLRLADIQMGPAKKKRFGVHLTLGRLWSKVKKTFGIRNKTAYRVQTVTAVAGVRGTTFDVSQDAEKTTRVAVFAGQVGVSPPLIDPEGSRKQITWPREVSEKRWEEIILSKQQRLTIAHGKRPAKPESFDSKTVEDDWVAWNLDRDSRQP